MSKKKVSAEKIVEELAAIGFAKATDYLCIEGNELVIKPTDQLKGASRAAIASLENTSNGIRLKLYDKMKALELLGKYLGMFDGKSNPENLEQNNLLEAIMMATREAVETDDISEIQ